jgi:flagellar biosynthetic protein FliR
MEAADAVVGAGLVFARVAGLCAALPLWSMDGVPRAAPVLVALTATAIIAPHAPVAPPPDALVVAVGGEVLLGLGLGAMVSMVFHAASSAGEVASNQSGANLGAVADPVSGVQVGVIGRVASLLGLAVFLALDLHHEALEAVALSFEAVPAGSPFLADPVALLGTAATSVSLGLQLAAPLVVGGFVVQIVMALLGRLAPRLHVFFSLGGPLAALVAMLLLAASLAWMAEGLAGPLQDATRGIATLGAP